MKHKKKKALLEFRCRVENAILGSYLLGKPPKNLSPFKIKRAREQLRDITLWGVPLLPSKGHEGTDIVLLKFLKAKDFKVHEAFGMLWKTLKWRREYKTEGILDEKSDSDLENLVCLISRDKGGHPLCFLNYGLFKDKELYKKVFGSEEKCDKFLRWKVQNMEKVIKKLRFKNGGVDSIVQIIDLKNSPGPAMKELHSVSKKFMLLLQDYYPELIHKIVVINVPLWYYASHVLLLRVINLRTKRKFVFARPSKATKILLKIIAPENLPVEYGGLKRENDDDFTSADNASEHTIRANSAAHIEFPVTEAGVTMVWDLTVVGWDVSYKEEFIPDDEGSYKILLQNQKIIGECVRNSFYISEPGRIVLTIDNGALKKKRVLYRSKAKPTDPMYIFLK
nr:patellin-4 [Quercus suber]